MFDGVILMMMIVEVVRSILEIYTNREAALLTITEKLTNKQTRRDEKGRNPKKGNKCARDMYIFLFREKE